MRGEHASGATALTCAILLLFGSSGNILVPADNYDYDLEPVVYQDNLLQENTHLASNRILKHVKIYGRSWSSSDISYVASNFDRVVVDFPYNQNSYNYETWMSQVKTAHSDIQIFGYKVLIGVYTIEDDWATCNAQEAWFMHDDDGNRITDTTYGNYIMDPASAGYRAHLVSYVNAKFAAYGSYDGFYADVAWDEISDYAGQLSSAVPAAKVTSWHADVLGLIQYVAANITGGKLFIVNTEAGWAFGHINYDYLDECDGMEIEGYYHAPWDVAANTDKVTSAMLTCVSYGVANSKIMLCEAGCSTASTQVQGFCYAGFLMAADQTYASFGWAQGSLYYDPYTSHYTLMDTVVGTLQGTYYNSQSIQMRDYSKGRALFNPSASSYSVNVGNSYTDAQTGATVPNTTTLSSYSGKTMLSTSTPEPDPDPSYYQVIISVEEGGSTSPSGTKEVAVGSSLNVTATAATYYSFSYWLKDGVRVNGNPITVSGGADGQTIYLRPVFTRQTYIVNVTDDGHGYTVPAGAQTVPAGNSFTATAYPDSNYAFTRWTRNGSNYSTDNPVSFTGTAGVTYTLTAVFAYVTPPTPPPSNWTVNITSTVGGSTTPSGVQTTSADTLQVTATAAETYIFNHWVLDGSVESTDNPYTLDGVNGEVYVLVAVFNYNPPTPPTPPPTPPPTYWTVQITSTVGGSVSPAGTQNTTDDTLTATATASSGYQFRHWLLNGSVTSTSTTYILDGVVGQSYILTAVFAANTPNPAPTINPIYNELLHRSSVPTVNFDRVIKRLEEV